MLPWKDKFDEVSRAFELRLGARVCRFLGIRLWFRTRRVYLIQNVCVASVKRHGLKERETRTLFRQTNRDYGSVGYQIRAGIE